MPEPTKILGPLMDALVTIEGAIHPDLTHARWAPFEHLDLPLLYHHLGDESRGVDEQSTHTDSVQIPIETTIAFDPKWPAERYAEIEAMWDTYMAHVVPALRDFDDLVPACSTAQLTRFATGSVELAGVELPALLFSLQFDLDIRFS